MIVRSSGGLCSRLRVLFSYRAAAPGGRLSFVWDVNHKCPGHFLDCFLPVPGVEFTSTPELCREVGLPVPEGIDTGHPVVSGLSDHLAYDGYNEHPQHRGDREFLYADLRPRAELRESVRSRAAAMGPFLALHVRRTDFDPLARSRGNRMKDAAFFRWIDERPDLPIYIATDNRATQEAFAARYPDRLRLPRWIEPDDRLRQTPLADAVVDLFTCAFAEAFLGTPGSSFSDLIRQIRHEKNRSGTPSVLEV